MSQTQSLYGALFRRSSHIYVSKLHFARTNPNFMILAMFTFGRAASGGALDPEPPRAIRSTPECIRNFVCQHPGSEVWNLARNDSECDCTKPVSVSV
jgi:hypothetical protein